MPVLLNKITWGLANANSKQRFVPITVYWVINNTYKSTKTKYLIQIINSDAFYLLKRGGPKKSVSWNLSKQ